MATSARPSVPALDHGIKPIIPLSDPRITPPERSKDAERAIMGALAKRRQQAIERSG
jgi:hypothetical protein